MTTIELQGITKSFSEPDGSVRSLFESADMRLASEDTSIAVLGRSGSGKSTLLNILAGLDVCYTGKYLIDGKELRQNDSAMSTFRRESVGIITQHYDLLHERSVVQNVMLGLGGVKAAHRESAISALELVGLADRLDVKVGKLSGGEAQRVALARAIVKDPAILLADEPTGALDEETEDAMLDLFDALQERGSTLIIATHSERMALRCERRYMIVGHELVEC